MPDDPLREQPVIMLFQVKRVNAVTIGLFTASACAATPNCHLGDLLRFNPIALMRELSVVGFMPSNAAAPSGPKSFPPAVSVPRLIDSSTSRRRRWASGVSGTKDFTDHNGNRYSKQSSCYRCQVVERPVRWCVENMIPP